MPDPTKGSGGDTKSKVGCPSANKPAAEIPLIEETSEMTAHEQKLLKQGGLPPNKRPWAQQMDAMSSSGAGAGGGATHAEDSSDVEAAAKDPGVQKYHAGAQPFISDNEILGHRHVFVGMNGGPGSHSGGHHDRHGHGHGARRAGGHVMVGGHRGARHRHHHHHGHAKKGTDGEDNKPVTPPSQRVEFILGEDYGGENRETHPVFSEMAELFVNETGEAVWEETARWVKFEEDVEEGGGRWSKPHVATLSLHSLFELRSLLLNGTVCLDMTATNMDDIAELALDSAINSNRLTHDKKAIVKEAILKRHHHQYQGKKHHHKDHGSSDGAAEGSKTSLGKLPLIRSLADIGRNYSSSKSGANCNPDGENGDSDKDLARCQTSALPDGTNGGGGGGCASDTDLKHKMNVHFLKKLPKDCESCTILVGAIDKLDKPVSCFIRLSESAKMGNLTEVDVPTRFMFVLLGPEGEGKCNVVRFHEIGRALATIMTDEVFHDIAYKAKRREHLLAGMDEFLDAVTVLPPGEWDPSIRIEPPQSVPSQDDRKHRSQKPEVIDHEKEEDALRESSGLTRSGRLFGGLINDIKRKKPFYVSDFKDALSVQCLASFIFIYFACLTPIITFGGLLGDATGNDIAAMESLVSGLIVGVTYGFFSGQPLTILGSTGPILVFETIVYDFCRDQMDWDYLPFRFCVGCWVGVILIVLVAVDASAFVCYITRFTEENFACLIAFIFIVKAIKKLLHIADEFPVHESACFCLADNASLAELYGEVPAATFVDTSNGSAGAHHQYACEFALNDTASAAAADGGGGVALGHQSVGCHFEPNAFLMSAILFVGTFLFATHLKGFKSQSFFPAKVRSFISDFAVIIAIASMSLLDLGVGVNTPKLDVPSEFKPTNPERTSWVQGPLCGHRGCNPWWSPIAAVLPGLLATILVFMDQQITAVIVNRKEHKLLKGGGYHLDLLIVAVLIVVCSVLGLPWFVAATVLSINHVKSLTKESECAAPGEKPQFLGIHEQRVTHILIFILIGLSVKLTVVLSFIPLPVLFGVFLYMGIAALNGIQFYDRILLIFMPTKYQPDTAYIRQVPLKRVHLFTGVQFLCLGLLWVIKDIKETSILFPIMLVVMMGIRKLLDYFFEESELKILDDILPHFKRQEHLDAQDLLDVEAAAAAEGSDHQRRPSLKYTHTSVELALANGNVLKIPLKPGECNETTCNTDINISEEIRKTGTWKSLEGNGQEAKVAEGLKKRPTGGGREKEKRMSVVKENNDEDFGITIKVSKSTPPPEDK